MHKINMTISKRMEAGMGRTVKLLKKYAGQIGYYACVALVLAAVAVAAERYRAGGEFTEELILPAVELATPAPVEAEPLFDVPEDLRIVRGYSDQPEWNAAHAQWQTHAAVDYDCPGGGIVSFSDGVVRTVGKSGIYGGFVEIASGAYLIRYASIAPLEELVPGESVEKGEMLGKTDASMPAEAHMDAHLHLEIYENGIYIDFSRVCGNSALTD